MRKHFSRPKPVAWFFFLLGFGLCLMAGSWQVNRLEWKQGLIAEIAAANEKNPLTALPRDDAELAALQFRKVNLSGTWRGNTEFHLAPRYWKNQFGYWVITPFSLADGRTILINRGWVPRDKKLLEKRPETRVRGYARVTGMVRVGAERNYFTPKSQPAKNIWFGRDIADMAAFAKLENVVPVMVDVVKAPALENPARQLKPVAPPLPIPSDGTIRLRNDHLSYVITWYGIALGILVIFLVYHRRK